MYLYHGTSARRADQALREGIRPRAETKLSNWDAHRSCDQAIYLTNAYPVYFGNVAASQANEDEAAYLVIDTDRLDASLLAADEDAIEQAMHHMDDDPLAGMSIGERTLHLKEQLLQLTDNGFTGDWSLKALGNCTYHGTIPPEAIVKVVRWRLDSAMSLACDPSISLMNFHIVGGYYRKMAAILADVAHDVPPSGFDALYPESSIHSLKALVWIEDTARRVAS